MYEDGSFESSLNFPFHIRDLKMHGLVPVLLHVAANYALNTVYVFSATSNLTTVNIFYSLKYTYNIYIVKMIMH